MDNPGLITGNKNSVSSFAVDGLFYGLTGGAAMILALTAFAWLSGEAPGVLLERFGTGAAVAPLSGLLSHLAVSAIYGIMFGAMVWPVLRFFSTLRVAGWLGGLVYAALLLLLAQTAILPASRSPLLQLHFWQWATAHGVYGLVLGGLFAQKAN